MFDIFQKRLDGLYKTIDEHISQINAGYKAFSLWNEDYIKEYELKHNVSFKNMINDYLITKLQYEENKQKDI